MSECASESHEDVEKALRKWGFSSSSEGAPKMFWTWTVDYGNGRLSRTIDIYDHCSMIIERRCEVTMSNNDGMDFQEFFGLSGSIRPVSLTQKAIIAICRTSYYGRRL